MRQSGSPTKSASVPGRFRLAQAGNHDRQMFASRRRLGYILAKAMATGDIDTAMAVTLLLAAPAASASALLLARDRRLHRRAAADPGV